MHKTLMRRKGEDMLAIFDFIWRIGFGFRFGFRGLGSKVQVYKHKNLMRRKGTDMFAIYEFIWCVLQRRV